MAKRSTTMVSYTPGSNWWLFRGKKLMAAEILSGRILVGIWKELPRKTKGRRKRGELIEWRDGQEMRLTVEEALDLVYAIGFMVHELDPNAKKKHRQWVARGRRRPPALRLVRGGAIKEGRSSNWRSKGGDKVDG
jgi:hypothetical protein